MPRRSVSFAVSLALVGAGYVYWKSVPSASAVARQESIGITGQCPEGYSCANRVFKNCCNEELDCQCFAEIGSCTPKILWNDTRYGAIPAESGECVKQVRDDCGLSKSCEAPCSPSCSACACTPEPDGQAFACARVGYATNGYCGQFQ